MLVRCRLQQRRRFHRVAAGLRRGCAHPSGSEARALLEGALDVHGGRERATSAEELQADVRAWREREHELCSIEQLSALLDDALRVSASLARTAIRARTPERFGHRRRRWP
jgi:hypothetical protein